VLEGLSLPAEQPEYKVPQLYPLNASMLPIWVEAATDEAYATCCCHVQVCKPNCKKITTITTTTTTALSTGKGMHVNVPMTMGKGH
jgi:hypothetical protein